MEYEILQQRPNSYIENLYFSDLTIQKSIDYITWTISDTDVNKISTILRSFKCRSISNTRLEKGNYEMKRTFLYSDKTNIRIDVFYGSKSLYTPAIKLNIHDPDSLFLRDLSSILNICHHHPKLSFVEMSFDFYSDDLKNLKDFLKAHLFMAYQSKKSKSFKEENTFYTNNLRKSQRGMRVYPKLEKNCVRMELDLKRSVIKKLNLTPPLAGIDSLDLSKYFCFTEVDLQLLRKYLIWSARKQTDQANSRRSGSGNLIVCMIDSWLRSLCIDDYDDKEIDMERSMMGKVEILKSNRGVPSYSRFLVPMEDFQLEFTRQVSSDCFLKN